MVTPTGLSQFESIRISPDRHSSFFFLFTETCICLKSSSWTKRIKGLFSIFAFILFQEVSRGLACKAAEVAHATRARSAITLLRCFLHENTQRGKIARVKFAEEVGTMSKNILRWINLVRGPIWEIHSLTLIIS